MSAVNFDRDLTYSGAIKDNLGLGTTPTAGTFATPLVHNSGVVQRVGGYVNWYTDVPVSIAQDETISLGVMLRTARENSVFRLRGSANHNPSSSCLIIAGYTNTPSGQVPLTKFAPVMHVVTATPIDLVVALDGVAMNGDEPDHTVVFALMYANGSGEAGQFRPQVSFSVQDLRVAPPEYEAARR